MKKILFVIFIVVTMCSNCFGGNITVNDKKLFIPEETLVISGITATDPAIVSLESNDFSVGDSIAFSVPEEQTLGPELIPYPDCSINWASGLGVGWSYEGIDGKYYCDGTQSMNTTVFRYDTIDGFNDRWYKTVVEIKDYEAGWARIYTGSTAAGEPIYANGVYDDRINASGTNTVYLWGDKNFRGSFDNVSVREILPVNGTPYQITAIDPGTGDITIDADFSGLAAPITTGEAFIYKRSNFVFLSDSGGVPPAESAILLESGDYLLLESGDYLLLE
jgi:hypothetical protein